MNIRGSNGLCVAAAFEGKGKVRQKICNDSDLLLWRIQDSDGHLTIINKNGKYLDNNGDLSEKGEPVLSFDKKPNGLNQEWKIVSLKEGKVLIEDKEHKKCFGDTGDQKGEEMYYHLWECSEHNHHQIFEFSKPVKNKWVYTPGWFNVIGSSGLCMSAKEDKELLQQTCGNGEDMAWKIEERENNLVFINKYGTVLDNHGSKNNNGNKVISQIAHNGPNQQWLVDPVADGKMIIYDSIHNKCIDNKGKKEVGSPFVIWNCDLKNVNQQYKLRLVTEK